MILTFERLQSLLTELSALVQFILAILGLITILLPLVQRLSIYHDDTTYILPNYMARFLHEALQQLGIPSVMMYIRPKEYYENLAKKLNESDLARKAVEADVCLAAPSNMQVIDAAALVSGLVNTGNTCFLNSVLQAMSSLPELHLYLEHMSTMANPDVSLPVTRSLLKTLRTLTKPLYRRSSFRPSDIVTALSSNRRIISREQQDAQEFFQLVSSAIEAEAQVIYKTRMLGGGLKELLTKKKAVHSNVENPFTGLLANRLSCMQCGYTGAIRHFSFNNIQLNVPNKYTTTLAECLTQFTSMEYLQDATCRKCSIEQTLQSLTKEITLLKQKKSSNKKKQRDLISQIVTLESAKMDIEHRFKMGRIEEEGESDKLPLLKSVNRMSSKQAMLAKPPKILCLHISRSAYLSTGAVYKNTCHLVFPEYLDVSAFCTNGTLQTQPNLPISSSSALSNSKYYKLMSVVVHYGSHSFGHFVAFKRRIYADPCTCHHCGQQQQQEWKCQEAWYRISDSKVDMCSLQDVLRSNPYMLIYELTNDVVEQESDCEEEKVSEQQEEILTDYSNIPMDHVTSEALRIANALLLNNKLD